MMAKNLSLELELNGPESSWGLSRENNRITSVYDYSQASSKGLRQYDRIISISKDILRSGKTEEETKWKIVVERGFTLPSNSKPVLKKPVTSHAKPRTTCLAVLPDNPDDIEDATRYDYAIMIIGKVGVGKSALCNFFFKEDRFRSEGGVVAVTPESAAHSCEIGGKRILFIDTAGFSDASTSNVESVREMGKAFLHARNGLDAIIICLSGESRFDDASANLMEELGDIEKLWSHAFVVFTHGRSMGRKEEDRLAMISRWKKDPKCPSKFIELLAKVQERIMIVESMNDDSSYYTEKSRVLVEQVQKISAAHNGRRYVHRVFEMARDKYEEAKQQKKQQRGAEWQKAQKEIKKNEEMMREYRQRFEECEKKNNELSNELQKMHHQLESAKEMEYTREQQEKNKNEIRLITLDKEKLERQKEDVARQLETVQGDTRKLEETLRECVNKMGKDDPETMEAAVDLMMQEIDASHAEKNEFQQQVDRQPKFFGFYIPGTRTGFGFERKPKAPDANNA